MLWLLTTLITGAGKLNSSLIKE